MAQIKKNDIIENGIFDNAVESSQRLLKVLDSIDKEFMKVSDSAKAIKQNLDFGKVSDIDKFIKLEQEMAGQFRQTTELMKKRKTVQDQLRAATDEEVKGKLRLKQVNKEQRDALKDEIILNNRLAGTEEKLLALNRRLRAERRKLNTETTEGARRLREINRSIDENNRKLRENSDQLKKQRLNVGNYSKAIKTNISRFVGWTAVISLATRAIRSAARDVVGFEKAQADLAGVLGTTRKNIVELTKDAKKLGATTIFKPKEVSALQKEYAKLGFGVDSILDMTKATLEFATATNTDLARSAEVIGNTLNAFQLSSEETTRVVNVMNESFSRSALDTERFSIAMGKVGAVATQAGMSLERTTSILGILVSNGIKAETAGTGLRNILLKVAETGEDLDTVLKEVNGSTDKAAFAVKKFGTQNAAVALTMANMQNESKELTEQLEKQGRTAEDVANEQMDTLSGAMKGLSSAWDGFILSLEEGDGLLSKVTRRLVEFTTAIINAVTELNQTSLERSQAKTDEATSQALEYYRNNVNNLLELSRKGMKELDDIYEDATTDVRTLKHIDTIRELYDEGFNHIEIRSFLLTDKIKKDTEDLEKIKEEISKREREREDVTSKALVSARKKLLKDRLYITNKENDDIKSIIAIRYDEETERLKTLLAEEEFLRRKRREVVISDLKKLSIEELQILTDSIDDFVAKQAQYVLDTKKLNILITEDEKKENGKRVKNYEDSLKKKLDLEKAYLREKKKLEEDGLEASNELEEFNIENQIELAEDEAERLKQINIERVENGFEYEEKRQIEFYQRKLELQKRYVEFLYQTQREANQKIYDDEEARIKRLEEQGLDPSKVEELRKKNQQVLDDSDTLAKQERNKKNRELDDEFKKDVEDFNKEIEDAQQKHNDEMDKLRDEQLKAEEEANQKRLEQRQELFDGLESIGQAFAEREQERINKELENIDLLLNKSRERVNQLRQNSSENRQTIESNIAFEEAKQAQLEKQRLEAEKKQRQIELATTAVEVYSNKVKNDDPNPLVNTIKDITLLQQFVKNIPLFWEGTDTTVGAALGAPHLNTARDGYIVRVDKNEKILNPHLSAMTGNMTTQEIAEAAYNYRMGITDYTNPFDLSNQSASVANVINNNSTYLLMQEISKQNSRIDETNDKLQELINKPVSSMFLDDTGAIPKIVQRTVQGNKTINQKRMLR